MKYYYTDPLKVAWMYREFGFIFTTDIINQGELYFHNGQFGRWIIRAVDYREFVAVKKDSKFYPVRSCHEMLKPQVGDLIEYSKHKTQYIAGTDRIHHEASMDGFCSLKDLFEWWDDDKELPPIIQRNGKAFFMPETEAQNNYKNLFTYTFFIIYCNF